MIISHKYKYIFIKPTKVAGTSIEIALAKHCGSEDVVTPIQEYDPTHDGEPYDQIAQNFLNGAFFNHMTPIDIKSKVGEEIWNNYYKFTVVRNPWDLVISRYFWEKKRPRVIFKSLSKKKVLSNLNNKSAYRIFFRKLYAKISKNFNNNPKADDFEGFLEGYRSSWINSRFYFFKDGTPTCDQYLRYENLNTDYDKLCRQLKIPTENLLKTKSKNRDKNLHYSNFYNEKTRQMVVDRFKKDIDYFNYEFEATKS